VARGSVRARPGRRGLVILLAAIVVVLIGALSALRIRTVARQLTDAHAALSGAEAHVRAGRLAAARGDLGRAERLVTDANGALHSSPELAVARILPVARQNIDALRRSVGSALALTNGGRQILDAASPLEGPNGRLQISLRGGQVPLESVQAVNTALKDVAFSLPEMGPRSPVLLGQVRQVYEAVRGETGQRRRQFLKLSRGLDVLDELAGGNGPRRYLIAVANSAEMRGTGGMILSYGELVSAEGKVSLERFGPIDELAAGPSVRPEPLPYPERFAPYVPLTTWRNTNLTSDFTVVAPVQERLYTAVTGKEVNGVLQIDSEGLAALLRITGPVDVPGVVRVDADNVVPFTLNQHYLQRTNRPERQEAQGEVAEAIFDRLVTGEFANLGDLASSVSVAARGRHIMLHSTTPAAQRSLAVLGVGGGLPAPGVDFTQLTVQNFSGTKLDYYLDTAITISGRRSRGSDASRVRVVVEIRNTAPPSGQDRAVFGPFDASFQPGEYRGLVSVYLPLGAHLAARRGSPTVTAPSTSIELDRSVVSYGVSVHAGQTHVLTLDVVLPARPDRYEGLVLVPAPRVRPTTASVDLDLGGGSVIRRTVQLTEPAFLGPRG
jgi:hypothetical protein